MTQTIDNPNLRADRLGASIVRIRERVASAKRELAKARERQEEAAALIERNGQWTAQDWCLADESYVDRFAQRVAFHQANLDDHEALFAELHGRAA